MAFWSLLTLQYGVSSCRNCGVSPNYSRLFHCPEGYRYRERTGPRTLPCGTLADILFNYHFGSENFFLIKKILTSYFKRDYIEWNVKAGNKRITVMKISICWLKAVFILYKKKSLRLYISTKDNSNYKTHPHDNHECGYKCSCFLHKQQKCSWKKRRRKTKCKIRRTG